MYISYLDSMDILPDKKLRYRKDCFLRTEVYQHESSDYGEIGETDTPYLSALKFSFPETLPNTAEPVLFQNMLITSQIDL